MKNSSQIIFCNGMPTNYVVFDLAPRDILPSRRSPVLRINIPRRNLVAKLCPKTRFTHSVLRWVMLHWQTKHSFITSSYILRAFPYTAWLISVHYLIDNLISLHFFLFHCRTEKACMYFYLLKANLTQKYSHNTSNSRATHTHTTKG